jgi:putative membrane protein
MDITQFPKINATLNFLSAALLLIGYIYISKGNQRAHRNCMVAAFCTSSLFLVCYLYYHYHARSTKFLEPAWFKPIYLVILVTHIILAVAMLPAIFATFLYALKGRFETHKKFARWTWPVWMYVSVTGVVIYLLLYQIFPQTPQL